MVILKLKQKFHPQKEPISIKNKDINKVAVSNKVSFGKKGIKYLLAIRMLKKVRPLFIFLQKWLHIEKTYETSYMSFLIKDNEFLEKYNEIWEKVTNSLKKEFDSEPLYHQKYLKAKINSCNGKINTNFHINIPKEDSQYICLSVILIDSVFRTGKNFYPQMLLEECKILLKKKRFLIILLTI